jgi:hypothetical protein
MVRISRKLVFSLLAGLIFSFSGSSAFVGGTPGSINFGEVEKGGTIQREIFVTTDFQREFAINPSYSRIRDQRIFEGPNRFEVSEKDISKWIELEQSTVNGSSEITGTLADGSKTTAKGSFTMTIDIPPDAQPGYHFGYVNINPRLISSSQDAPGSLNWGESKIPFQMRVEGNANRQVSVINVRGFRLDEDQAAVEMLLRNEGSVTTTTRGFSFDIYDQRRNEITSLYANSRKLDPREEAWVEATWNSEEEIDEGTYQVDGQANYVTGSATASGSFSLPGIERVQVRPSNEDEEDGKTGGGVPVWFVVIVLSILGVLMWGFDIEPFWIVAVLGVLGISAFILLSGVPNYVLAILLIVVVIVIYGGI